MLYALSSPITQTDTNRDGLRLEQLLTNLPFLSSTPKSHTASVVRGERHIRDVAHALTAGSDIRRVYVMAWAEVLLFRVQVQRTQGHGYSE